MSCRILTWNVEWATPEKIAGQHISRIITDIDPDIIVLTEGCAELLPPEGFIVDAGTDWGYAVKDKRRRKVLMWSKQPWLDTDTADRSTLPSGRFIAGTTSTNLGDIRIYGVCIPWHSAHVRNGREDRRPWQDHEIYLRGLPSLIAETQFPIVVAGDYNQRIPAKSQPKTMFELLTTAISGLVVSSAIDLDKPLLDHIAHSSSLQSGLAVVIPDTFNGVRLTDHRGVHVELVLKPI